MHSILIKVLISKRTEIKTYILNITHHTVIFFFTSTYKPDKYITYRTTRLGPFIQCTNLVPMIYQKPPDSADSSPVQAIRLLCQRAIYTSIHTQASTTNTTIKRHPI